MNSKIAVLVFGFLFFIGIAFAGVIDVSTSGNFYNGGLITISGQVDPQATDYIEISLLNTINNSNTTTHTTADIEGYYSQDFNLSESGDYLLTVTDANTSATKQVNFNVRDYTTIVLGFAGAVPPLSVSDDLIVNFTLEDIDSEILYLHDYNLSVKLYSTDGTLITSEDITKDVNSNQTDDLNFGAMQETGTYTIVVDDGISSFSIPVIAYNLFINSYDSITGEVKSDFSIDSTSELRVFLSNSQGEIINGEVSGTIEDPAGNTSTLDFSEEGGYYTVVTDALSLEGEYIVRVSAEYNDYIQEQEFKLKVNNYILKLQPEKFSLLEDKDRIGGGIYPPNSEINLELKITDLNTSQNLSGEILDTACDENKFTLNEYSEGSTISNSLDFTINNSEDTYCLISFNSEQESGNYLYELTGTDLNISGETKTLSSSTTITIQNHLIFIDTVDPSTYLENPTNSWKFEFFQGQDIGFYASTLDLNSNLDSNISDIISAYIYQGDSEIEIDADYIDYNESAQFITLSSDALTENNINGGMVQIKALVSVSSSNPSLDENIYAYAVFKYRKLNISIMPASDQDGSEKMSFFGPATYNSDESIYLKVNVTNAADSEINYAQVQLDSLFNADTWQDINVSLLNSLEGNYQLNTGSEGGIAVYLIPSGVLENGTYLGQIKVTSGEDIDYAQFFFMVKDYIVFAQPMFFESDGEGGYYCNFLDVINKQSDVNLVVMAINPDNFNTINDYEIDLENTQLYLMGEGKDKGGMEPVVYNGADLTLGSDINCSGFMGEFTKTFQVLTLTPTTDDNSWIPGFYRILIDGTSEEFGHEYGDGFLNIQPFGFGISINVTDDQKGGKGILVSPGTYFDFNVSSDNDVNLTARLIDEATQSEINSNLDLNTTEGGRFVSSNTGLGEDGKTEVSVLIPEDLGLGNYVIEVIAEDAAHDTAAQGIPINVSFYQLAIPEGVERQSLWYRTLRTGEYDTNILLSIDYNANSSNFDWDLNEACNGVIDTGNLDLSKWNRWVYPNLRGRFENVFNHMI
ncbi:MAG: hypothetical protein V1824_00835, partial [archaeon]